VREVYGVTWTAEPTGGQCMKREYLIQGIEELPSDKLREFLEERNKRLCSNIGKKYHMVMEYFMKSNSDVIFIQEAGTVDWGAELLPSFGWVRGGDSVILYRKSKFGSPKVSMLDEYRSKLKFNGDTAVYLDDRGYLLLSIHLASKKEINIEQANTMFQVLEELHDMHPLTKIIIGIDANHFIGGSRNNFLNFVPKSKEHYTTLK
jgi:hypothetical protein